MIIGDANGKIGKEEIYTTEKQKKGRRRRTGSTFEGRKKLIRSGTTDKRRNRSNWNNSVDIDSTW